MKFMIFSTVLVFVFSLNAMKSNEQITFPALEVYEKLEREQKTFSSSVNTKKTVAEILGFSLRIQSLSTSLINYLEEIPKTVPHVVTLKARAETCAQAAYILNEYMQSYRTIKNTSAFRPVFKADKPKLKQATQYVRQSLQLLLENKKAHITLLTGIKAIKQLPIKRVT